MVGWHLDSTDMNLSKLQEIVKDKEAWHAEFMGWQRFGHDLETEQQEGLQAGKNMYLKGETQGKGHSSDTGLYWDLLERG